MNTLIPFLQGLLFPIMALIQFGWPALIILAIWIWFRHR